MATGHTNHQASTWNKLLVQARERVSLIPQTTCNSVTNNWNLRSSCLSPLSAWIVDTPVFTLIHLSFCNLIKISRIQTHGNVTFSRNCNLGKHTCGLIYPVLSCCWYFSPAYKSISVLANKIEQYYVHLLMSTAAAQMPGLPWALISGVVSVVQPSAFHETLVHVLFCPPVFPLLRMPPAPGTWPSFRHGCLIPSFDIWCVSLVLPLFCILFVPLCLLSWDSLFPKSQVPFPPSINSPWNSASL